VSAVWKSNAGRKAVLSRYREILTRLPVEQITVPTRQGDTFVLAAGPKDAPVIMLHHGSMANSVMSVGDMLQWSQYFRCYAVDMIGEPGFSADVRPPLDSDAHALWLEDVWRELGVTRAALAGTSLGGWLVLDFATRHPGRIDALSLMCPSGIGRQLNFLAKAWPYLLLGSWGRKRMAEMVLGKRPENPSPAMKAIGDFIALIQANFRARIVKIPQMSDAALQQLKMPVSVWIGGKDVLLDSADTRRRLEANIPQAEVHFLPEAGHFIPSPAGEILDFFKRAAHVP
jgi:pimeloyl-ACP methyl ester carboxylesterase